MHVHEDCRRVLIDWANGSFKSAKVVIAKDGCTLGMHYHNNKDETFLLASGWCDRSAVGNEEWGQVKAPFIWHVPRGAYHYFMLQGGAILCGVATEEFDPEDENRG